MIVGPFEVVPLGLSMRISLWAAQTHQWYYFIFIPHFGTKVVPVTSLSLSFILQIMALKDLWLLTKMKSTFKGRGVMGDTKRMCLKKKGCTLTFEGRFNIEGVPRAVWWTNLCAPLSCEVRLGHSFRCINSICWQINPVTLLSHLLRAQRVVDEKYYKMESGRHCYKEYGWKAPSFCDSNGKAKSNNKSATKKHWTLQCMGIAHTSSILLSMLRLYYPVPDGFTVWINILLYHR